MDSIVLASTLAWPKCGLVMSETMPVDACQFFYECPACKTLLKVPPGNCCVYCPYGS